MDADDRGRTQIGPRNLSKVVDTSARVLRGAWVREPSPSRKVQLTDPLEAAQKIVKRAKETVLLYTARATHPDLNLVLEDERKSGIRVYALASNLDQHQKTFRCGLMREQPGASSTLVLVDAKGRGATGIWFGGELTSQQGNVPFVLQLEPSQVQQAASHFSHLFWRARGRELFLQRLRDALPIRPEQPVVGPSLPTVFRREGVEAWIRGRPMDQLWLGRGTSALFVQRAQSVKHLVCEVCEDFREVLKSWRGKSVDGNRPIGFSLAEKGRETIVFRDDFGFLLTSGQRQALDEAFPSWEWRYGKEVRISEVRGVLLRDEDNWDSAQPSGVDEQVSVPLSPVVGPNLRDWKRGLPEPKPLDNPPLSLRVEYSWTLVPPALPDGAQKDDLYGMWERFDQALRDRLSRLREDLAPGGPDGAAEAVKRRSGSGKGERNRLLAELESLEKNHWGHLGDRASFLDAVGRLEALEASAAQRPRERDHEGHSELTELQSEGPPRGGQGGKPPVTKRARGSARSDLAALLPNKTLPSVGTLWRHGRSRYLAIRFEEELDLGEEEAKAYGAVLVWGDLAEKGVPRDGGANNNHDQ